MRLRGGLVVLCAWLLAAAPVSAGETLVTADEAVLRSCAAELHPAGTPGTVVRKWTATVPGLFTARLDGGLEPDWDLAIFRPGTRAAVAAATSVASTEQASLWVKPGDLLAIQACRRAGDAVVPLELDLFPMALPTGATERFSLESVPIDGPADVAFLEGELGLDVTHDVHDGAATVALYSDPERAALAAAGFVSRTLVADMAASDRRARTAEAEAAQVGVASPLPSGRETYRVYADYTDEMQELADDLANENLVKRYSIGETLEGNSIDALEIAADVNRQDDGRPVYLNLGVHHAREWPSGEFPMEFAHDLVQGYGTNQRITDLLERVRVIIVPVVNVDGFMVSRSFGETPADGNQNATLGLSLTDTAAYKRKNCRAVRPELQAVPCAARPAVQGVDPNRNYGAYWGGVGSSTDPTSQGHRGAAPFSEPETQAIHELSSRLHPTMVVTSHTFTTGGTWLRQPGFRAFGDTVPDEAAMADLGAGMAAATGWANQLAWAIGQITGATEDWNYFAQGAYGYTPEAKGPNFHADYATMVVNEYIGTGPRVGLGVREAFLLAGERAANPADHSVVEGTAPAGATLRLTKSFQTPTCQPSCQAPALFVDEVLDTTMTVPVAGNYEWHINQSTRPLVTQTEFWTMTCQVGEEEPSTTTFAVARGARFTPEWTDGSCASEQAPNEPPVAAFTFSPSKPRTGQPVTFISTSTDPENAIALHEWDLDEDGAFDDAAGATVLWTFAAPGPRDVSLRVTDGGGVTDVVTRRLQVRGSRG